MMQLLQFLREQGVCPLARGSSVLPMRSWRLRTLPATRARSADATIGRVSTTARQLLISRSARTRLTLGLAGCDVVAFVQHESSACSRRVVKNTVTGLRAFLRYAQYCGAAAPISSPACRP